MNIDILSLLFGVLGRVGSRSTWLCSGSELLKFDSRRSEFVFVLCYLGIDSVSMFHGY